MAVRGVGAAAGHAGDRLCYRVRETEGKNYRFEFRDANMRSDLIPTLSRELADQKVTLIVAATTLQLEAAKAATQSIPIVFTIGTDPVENGFVASLSKPGGNITGIYNLGLTLIGKRVEILREFVPSVTKFAFLTDPGNLTLTQLQLRNVKAAADLLDLNILNVTAHTQDELEAAFETAVREGTAAWSLERTLFSTRFSRNWSPWRRATACLPSTFMMPLLGREAWSVTARMWTSRFIGGQLYRAHSQGRKAC